MTPRKNMQARCSIDSLSSPIVPFHRPGCHDHDVRVPYRFRFPTERPLSPVAGDPSVGRRAVVEWHADMYAALPRQSGCIFRQRGKRLADLEQNLVRLHLRQCSHAPASLKTKTLHGRVVEPCTGAPTTTRQECCLQCLPIYVSCMRGRRGSAFVCMHTHN